MARKYVRATGVFKGLRIPINCRGKFVLCAGGRVVHSSRSVRTLLRKAAAIQKPPVVIGVPAEGQTIAAY